MPLTCMNREVGNRIGQSIGSVEEVDVTGDGVGWGRCLRNPVGCRSDMRSLPSSVIFVGESIMWVSHARTKPATE